MGGHEISTAPGAAARREIDLLPWVFLFAAMVATGFVVSLVLCQLIKRRRVAQGGPGDGPEPAADRATPKQSIVVLQPDCSVLVAYEEADRSQKLLSGESQLKQAPGQACAQSAPQSPWSVPCSPLQHSASPVADASAVPLAAPPVALRLHQPRVEEQTEPVVRPGEERQIEVIIRPGAEQHVEVVFRPGAEQQHIEVVGRPGGEQASLAAWAIDFGASHTHSPQWGADQTGPGGKQVDADLEIEHTVFWVQEMPMGSRQG